MSRKFLIKLFFVLLTSISLVASNDIGQGTVSINFRNVDIRIIAESVGKVLGKNVIIDPRVKGQVTIYAEDRIPVENLLDVMRMILSQQGYDAVDTQYALNIVPSQVSPSIVPSTLTGGSYEQVTEVITIKNIPANSVLPVVQPFLTQYAKIQVIPNSSKLVITDLSINVDRVKHIISQIDTVLINDFDAIELKHGSATDILTTLRSVFNEAPVKFEIDVRSNKIFVVSSSTEIRLAARAIISEFDTELKSQRKGNMEVFFLKYSKAEKLAPILTTMLSSNAYSDLEYASTQVLSAQTSAVPTNAQKPSGSAPQYPSKVQRPQVDPTPPSSGSSSSKPANPANGEQAGAKFSIQSDNDLNAIVVIGEYSVLDAVGYFIERLDIPRAQVAIDVIIAELSDTTTTALGIDYTAISSGQTISGIGWGTLINFIQVDTKSKLLSTPYMTALDNSEVKFVVGEERPFTTGSYSSTGDSGNPDEPFQTIERKNVGIEVTITPQINDGNTVTLDSKQKISAVLPGTDENSENVVTTNRELNNHLIVNSGEIVVMGGLGQEEVNEVEKGIPYLKELPVMGYLFKYQSKETNRKTIAIFIRTTILHDIEEVKNMSLYKYSRFRTHLVKQDSRGMDGTLNTFDNLFTNQSFEQESSVNKVQDTAIRNLQSQGETDVISGKVSEETRAKQKAALEKARSLYLETMSEDVMGAEEVISEISNSPKNREITPDGDASLP